MLVAPSFKPKKKVLIFSAKFDFPFLMYKNKMMKKSTTAKIERIDFTGLKSFVSKSQIKSNSIKSVIPTMRNIIIKSAIRSATMVPNPFSKGIFS